MPGKSLGKLYNAAFWGQSSKRRAEKVPELAGLCLEARGLMGLRTPLRGRCCELSQLR